MKKSIRFKIFGLLTCVIMAFMYLVSCDQDKGTNIPDVAHITEIPEWVNFHFSICDPDTTQLTESAVFNSLFYEQVVPIVSDTMSDEQRQEAILDFKQDERIQWLCDTTLTLIGLLDPIQGEINRAFQYYQYHFPDRDLPRIYTLVSEFGYLPFIFTDFDGRDGIGLGLDMFLGEEFPYRKYVGPSPAFSQYLTRTYNVDHIPMRVMEVLIEDMAGYAGGERLVDQMIHNGIKKYVLSKMLPMAHDSIIMSYSGEEMKWCQDNEQDIWAHFLYEDLLYNQDRLTIQKLITPSPNAPGMPQDAPGNTGTWIGWRIVEHYMARYPETSMGGLIQMKNAQDILDRSKYRPAKR